MKPRGKFDDLRRTVVICYERRYEIEGADREYVDSAYHLVGHGQGGLTLEQADVINRIYRKLTDVRKPKSGKKNLK